MGRREGRESPGDARVLLSRGSRIVGDDPRPTLARAARPRRRRDRAGPTPAGLVTAVAQTLRTDPTAWDAFVEHAPTGAYQQLSAWARVKRSNGWRAERVVFDGPS